MLSYAIFLLCIRLLPRYIYDRIYINLRFPMRRRKASHQRVGSSQWKKTMAFAILPIR